MDPSIIGIAEVNNRTDLRKFIHLPAKIHKNHSNWVPPIYMDEWVFFNPNKNEAFSHSSTKLLLATRGKKVVGRIMGIVNHQYNAKHKQKHARFCFLETYNEPEVAQLLLSSIENWAIEQGMVKLVGPLGFSDKDPQGLLTEGFDEPNVIATNCNFPYLVDFVHNAGFKKEVDLVVYKVSVPETIPDFYLKILERAESNYAGLNVVHLKTKRDIKRFVRPVLSLMNQTFRDIYGFTELSPREMDEFASRYLMVLDPRFLKIICNEYNEVIAFVLGMPDLSLGVKRSKGYMLPFGIFQVLHSQKITKQLNLLLGAVHPNYQNRGLSTLLGVNLLKEAQAAGMERIDSHLELENNVKVRGEMEKMGGIVYKRFRIFGKSI
jgi:hypothetical protein